MAMQQSGKQPAAPGSDPKLSADDADELAANFKPAWEVDEPADNTIDTNDVPTIVTQGDPPTMTAVTQVNGSASNGPAIVASPVISIGSPAPDPPRTADTPRAPEPSSEALEPDQVIEIQPAAVAATMAKTQPTAQKPVSKPPPAPATAAMSTRPRTAPAAARASKDPFAAPAKAIRPPIESDDFAVPKKSGKGWVYVVVGLLVAVGAGGIVKFYLSGDEPQKASTPQNVAVPTAAKEDVPPPPAKDETPTAPATTAAKVEAPTPPPEPVKVTPPPEPVRAPPPPPPRPQPVAVRGGGGGGMSRPPPPPQPKTPPKPPGGGIVRDNPF